MLIDEIYQALLVLANKNQRGKITPTEYNFVLPIIIQKIYDEYFGDNRKSVNKKNVYRNGVNLSDEQFFINQLLEYYIVPNVTTIVTDGTFSIPNEVDGRKIAYIHSIIDSNKRVYDKVDFRNLQLHLSNTRYAPSECYPEYCLADGKITINPETASVKVSYIRFPKKPKYTYVEFGGREMFNPDASDFQDIDMHERQKDRILYELCIHFGLSIREAEMVHVGQALESDEYQKEQSS